jgi:hypothetical protein
MVGRSQRSKSPRYAYNNDDDEIEMGAACFTQRVHRMPVPKGFKYLTISKSMTGHRSHSHGYQIICKK